MKVSASRREQAPLSLRYLLRRTARTYPTPGCATLLIACACCSITPPMTQLNTPYPATAYLTGFLRQHADRLGLEVAQADAALELFLRVFSRPASARARRAERARRRDRRGDRPRRSRLSRARSALRRHGRCGRAVPPGPRSRASRCASSARRCCPRGRGSPRSSRARARDEDDPLAWAFGELGIADRAKHLASLYIDDLADVIRDGIAPDFELVALRRAARGERADVRSAARGARGRADAGRRRCSTSSRASCVAQHRPDVVGLTAPFPGNVYGAFRIARAIKAARAGDAHRARRRLRQHRAARALRPARVRLLRLHHLDDGEAPMLALIEHLRDPAQRRCCARSCATAARSCSTTDPTHARHPAARRRHADLRGPAARSLPVAVRDAQPDASAVVRRPLEQADDRARLLLEAVHVLRRHARLHRALRPRAGRPARRSHRGADRRDRADRLSLRRRGGAARRAARARRSGCIARKVDDHVVGQHPLREGVHARARASCSRARAASRSAAASRSRPIGCSS